MGLQVILEFVSNVMVSLEILLGIDPKVASKKLTNPMLSNIQNEAPAVFPFGYFPGFSAQADIVVEAVVMIL